MIIDIHGHIGRILSDRKEFIDPVNLLSKMDSWGISLTCVLPLSEHPEGAYLECDTEDIISACARYPERLIPFCLIDPRHGNRHDMDFSHLLEEYAGRGCKGLGELLPKLDFDDPLCMNLYKQAGKYGLPVLFDMHDTMDGYGLRDDHGLPKLENALRACPSTVFIGHGPTFWAEISAVVKKNERSGYPPGPVRRGGAVSSLMSEYPNLWADISARSGHNAMTRDKNFTLEFLDKFQDRITFGTDSCRRSDLELEHPNVSFIRQLEISKSCPGEALEKIKWKNCNRLLKLNLQNERRISDFPG